jgi:hypothetical protein
MFSYDVNNNNAPSTHLHEELGASAIFWQEVLFFASFFCRRKDRQTVKKE